MTRAALPRSVRALLLEEEGLLPLPCLLHSYSPHLTDPPHDTNRTSACSSPCGRTSSSRGCAGTRPGRPCSAPSASATRAAPPRGTTRSVPSVPYVVLRMCPCMAPHTDHYNVRQHSSPARARATSGSRRCRTTRRPPTTCRRCRRWPPCGASNGECRPCALTLPSLRLGSVCSVSPRIGGGCWGFWGPGGRPGPCLLALGQAQRNETIEFARALPPARPSTHTERCGGRSSSGGLARGRVAAVVRPSGEVES